MHLPLIYLLIAAVAACRKLKRLTPLQCPSRITLTPSSLGLLLSSACRKPEQLIHTEQAKQAGVQVIKRFSGGGTVVTDSNTLFATLIMHSRCDALLTTRHRSCFLRKWPACCSDG